MNKSKWINFSFILIILIGVSSCVFMGFNGIKGNGTIVKENRDVKGFKTIEISGAFIVYLQPSNSENIVVETDENLMQYISIKKVHNALIIETDENINPSHESRITISYQELNAIDVSGACEINSNSMLVFDQINIEGSGATKLNLSMEAQEAHFDFSGASKINLEGSIKNCYFEGSGATEINADDMETQNCTVDISGATKANIFVQNQLSVDASGASKIRYKGDAKIVNQDLSGASSIKRLN